MTKSIEEQFGVTKEWIEQSAKKYEDGTQTIESGEVFKGSHLDAVGSRRVTVVYPSSDASKVDMMAKSRGCKSSEIYRLALKTFLELQRA